MTEHIYSEEPMPAECYEDEIREWKERCRVLEEELLRARRARPELQLTTKPPRPVIQEQQEFLPRSKQLQLPISRRTWHRSSEYRRVEFCEREKTFADEWEKENQEIPGLNSGMGIMQHLTDVLEGGMTARDACVAASAIQWLGTNCGLGFLGKVVQNSPGIRDSMGSYVRRGDAVQRDRETVAWCIENSWKVAEAIEQDDDLYRRVKYAIDRRQEKEVEKRTATRRRAMIRRT